MTTKNDRPKRKTDIFVAMRATNFRLLQITNRLKFLNAVKLPKK